VCVQEYVVAAQAIMYSVSRRFSVVSKHLEQFTLTCYGRRGVKDFAPVLIPGG